MSVQSHLPPLPDVEKSRLHAEAALYGLHILSLSALRPAPAEQQRRVGDDQHAPGVVHQRADYRIEYARYG